MGMTRIPPNSWKTFCDTSFPALKVFEFALLDEMAESMSSSTIIPSIHTPGTKMIPLQHLSVNNVDLNVGGLLSMMFACTSLQSVLFRVCHTGMGMQMFLTALLAGIGGNPAPSLPSMVSFALVVDEIAIAEPVLFTQTVANLVLLWLRNPLRQRKFHTLSLSIYEIGNFLARNAETIFADIRKHLGPGHRGVTDAEHGLTLRLQTVDVLRYADIWFGRDAPGEGEEPLLECSFVDIHCIASFSSSFSQKIVA
ncbi:hypothetical protein H0H81_006286 [Sphagnurus paluster]|uniref:Uncharacterized protein n=1 Tax=Sphagnurus paluster TaxID=117069 RepID=A0A9P7GK51_9AGAR|nr:hypothetical protein H0H81_006286 [Sphagnurus paluster]